MITTMGSKATKGFVPRLRKPLAAALTVGLVGLGLVACSSSGSKSSAGSAAAGSNLPATVTLSDFVPLTGVAATYGPGLKQGAQLAVDDINSSKFLGNTQLAIDYSDDQTAPSVAAQLANANVGKYPIMLGSAVSELAAAEAPTLAKAGQPAIFVEAGGDGVLVSPSIFRLTPLLADMVPLTLKYLQAHNVKTLASLYDADSPTYQALEQATKSEAPQYGIKVVGTVTSLLATTDIASSVSKLTGYGSEAIEVLLNGNQNATAANLISQQNYPGLVIAQSGAQSVLAGSGNKADGWTWPVDWLAPGQNQASKDFTTRYMAKFGSTPAYYAAEAYDQVYFAARALKAANSIDKDALVAALKSVGETGFSGLLGDIKVRNNQESGLGFLVQVQGGKVSALTS
jgi:branched-chain amino acid transport system substrate-binding protein